VEINIYSHYILLGVDRYNFSVTSSYWFTLSFSYHSISAHVFMQQRLLSRLTVLVTVLPVGY